MSATTEAMPDVKKYAYFGIVPVSKIGVRAGNGTLSRC